MTDQDLRNAWAAQPLPEAPPPPAADALGTLHELVGRRNRRETVAAAFVVAWMLVELLLTGSPLRRLGCAALIAGTGFVLWQLHTRAALRLTPSDLARPCAEFLLEQLTRQQRALRSAWAWYVLPIVPGLALCLADAARVAAATPWVWMGSAAASAVVLAGIAWINRRAAASLEPQRQALLRSLGQ